MTTKKKTLVRGRATYKKLPKPKLSWLNNPKKAFLFWLHLIYTDGVKRGLKHNQAIVEATEEHQKEQNTKWKFNWLILPMYVQFEYNGDGEWAMSILYGTSTTLFTFLAQMQTKYEPKSWKSAFEYKIC